MALDEVKQNGCRLRANQTVTTTPMSTQHDRQRRIPRVFQRATFLVSVSSLAACGSASSSGTDSGTQGAGTHGGSLVDGAMCCPSSAGGLGAAGTTGGAMSSMDGAVDDGGAIDPMDASAADESNEAAADGAGGAVAVPGDGGCIGSEPLVEAHPIEGATHVETCSPVSYGTNPPSSGNHYPIWAAFKTYTVPIPWGFLVHDLEHGAIVITYNCPEGCADEVAQAQALIDSLPPDPECGSGPPAHRYVIAPAPDIGVRFAASAWGYTLRACSFDRAAFAAFIDAHYAMAYENLCADGEDPTGGPSGTPLCPGL